MHFLMEYPAIAVYLASLQISLLETDFNKKKKTDQCQRPAPHVHRAGWEGPLSGPADELVGRHI